MIDFMVIGFPRSGTTWCANWLTTDTTLCLHDPLFDYHYSDLDSIKSNKMVGVSCTGLWNFPEWVNKHPARKVIVHRELSEVNHSLDHIGLPTMPWVVKDKLDAVIGLHVEWEDMFNNPKGIYEYLLQKPFDAERHKELVKLRIEPDFEQVTVNKNVTRRIISEMANG